MLSCCSCVGISLGKHAVEVLTGCEWTRVLPTAERPTLWRTIQAIYIRRLDVLQAN